MNETISVIIPIYKVEEYLEQCIYSIVSQTYSNLEIILVDDGSPDKCAQICDMWARRDCRIRVIHKKNGGLSDARNSGILVASGDYIAFVDGDDWIASDMYEHLIYVLRNEQSDIVACGYDMVWDEQYRTSLTHLGKYENYNTVEGLRELIHNHKIQQVVWNKLYKASIVKSHLFEFGKCHEDEFWSYQVYADAKKTTVLEYIGYHYRQRSNSIMGAKYTMRRLDAIDAKVQRQEFLTKNYPELQFDGELDLFFECLYHAQQIQSQLHGKEKNDAWHFIKNVIHNCQILLKYNSNIKFTHKFWIWISDESLELACILRNFLKIGI